MAWDPTQRENNINDPHAQTGEGASANSYPTPPPYGMPENPYAPTQNAYGAPPQNPYAAPPYGYAPPYPVEPGYVPPEAHPLPLGEAIRQLPRQYLKVTTHPGVRSFVEEMGKAAWNIIWVQLIGLIIIDTLLGLLGIAITSATTTTTAPTTASTQQILAISRGIGLYATLGQIVLIPLFFFIGMGILYGLAKAFGGQGTFVTQGYTYLLFDVPLGIVSSLVGLIPVAGSFIVLGIAVYRVVLAIFATMAVHRLSGGRASAVVLIPIAVGLILLCGFGIALGAYLVNQLQH